MRDQRPIRTARRKTRQQDRERHGVAVRPCTLCVQEHHEVGKNHDSELTTPRCEMHHREIHEQMLQAGISLTFEPNPVKRVATMLRCSAIDARARADAMERWADLLDPQKEEDQ